MFNLLMYNVQWDARNVRVPLGRLFEYTDDHVRAEFSADGSPVLERLTQLPCLFCEEGTDAEVARVGQINRARIADREIILEVAFDSDVPALTNGLLYDNRSELGMSDWEFSRNHWAVKQVDLYRFLLRTVRPRRQLPSVFQIPEHEQIESVLVSAMMPFDEAFNGVYACITEAAEAVQMRCRRADDIWENPAIIQDVVSLIDRSRVVVCDCSGRNPNVFYEAGIAHTLGRDVILITQDPGDIPFDLRHLRFIPYLNNGEGRAALAAALQDRMRYLVGH